MEVADSESGWYVEEREGERECVGGGLTVSRGTGAGACRVVCIQHLYRFRFFYFI